LRGLPLWSGVTDGTAASTLDLEAQCAELCLQSASDTILAIHRFFSTRPANRLEWWYGL
jgi:hypothetical protein